MKRSSGFSDKSESRYILAIDWMCRIRETQGSLAYAAGWLALSSQIHGGQGRKLWAIGDYEFSLGHVNFEKPVRMWRR